MTYLAFLSLFIAPPIVLLAAIQRRPLAGTEGGRSWWALPLTCLIAFVYTTPWDNYLVYRGVWTYGPERVIGTIGYVPIEEYLFFLLQPIFTGLLLYVLLWRHHPSDRPQQLRTNVTGSIPYMATSICGVVLLLSGNDDALYLGLILTWACPVLAGMWLYAGSLFWALRRPALLAVAAPTIYLWIADRIAIGLGIWDISDAYSFDLEPLGLPIEEAVFFLVTNILVVQGVMLFLYGDRIHHKVPIVSR